MGLTYSTHIPVGRKAENVIGIKRRIIVVLELVRLIRIAGDTVDMGIISLRYRSESNEPVTTAWAWMVGP